MVDNDSNQFAVMDASRNGFPEPTLLPHLAKYVAFEHLSFLVDAAEVLSGGYSNQPWPRLISATCQVVAKRIDEQPNHAAVTELLKTHSSLYEYIGEESLEVAIDAANTNTRSWETDLRAKQFCTLAARFPNYQEGLLSDLMSAAIVDLDNWNYERLDAWLLPFANQKGRQGIIRRCLDNTEFELESALTLFANANEQEREQLITICLRRLIDQGLSDELMLAFIGSVISGASNVDQKLLQELYAKHLHSAAMHQVDWWLALVISFSRNIDLNLDLQLKWLQADWTAWFDSFTAERHEIGFADVMRAHIGITDVTELAKLQLAAAQNAEELLDQIMARWGGAEEMMVSDADDSDEQAEEAPAPEIVAESLPPENSPKPPAPASPQPSVDSIESTSPSRSVLESMTNAVSGAGSAIGGLLGGLFKRGEHESIEIPSATRGPTSDPDAQAEEAIKSQPRRLQVDIGLEEGSGKPDQQVLKNAFVAGENHTISISIGRGASLRVSDGIDESIFDANPESDSQRLDVRFIYQQQVSSASLELPKDARLNSDTCLFSFQVPTDTEEVKATIVILHNGRLLKAATLSGTVVSSPIDELSADSQISFEVTDAHDFSDLDQRKPFDASIVTDGFTSSAFAGASIGVRDLKGLDKTIDRMTSKLFKASEAVTIAGQGGDPTKYEQLLVFLAVNGKVLHSMLIRQLMPSLDVAERIQIVSTNPSAMLPLEFIYSGPSPKRNAKLCESWGDALKTGHCASCQLLPDDQRSDTICPLNFWAFSKVIERHAPRLARADGHDFFVDSKDLGQRKKLAPMENALFAASDNVPEHLVDSTLVELRSVINKCDDARTWSDWESNVQAHSPSLIVSMPHNALDPIFEISTLEIGRGDELRAGEVQPKHVRKEGSDTAPLVLLLGCQTAVGAAQPFHTFVGEFRHCGASIVVGTLATVLAEHAAPVVQAIVRELAKPVVENKNTVGDLLLGIRREMFAQGILISLAVAAFGDADWELAQIGE